MPAVVSSTDRSSGGGTSDADGTLRWSRSSKYDRNFSRISAAFTDGESRWVARRLIVWEGARMGGRHVMVILGAAGALMATAPATDAAASFKWTAASIGEAF